MLIQQITKSGDNVVSYDKLKPTAVKGRELFIDYAKAISIVLVVCTHAGISQLNTVAYIFMTLFFFASGYTAHYEKNSISCNIIKLFKKIIIPFWVAMFIYGIWEIFRAQYLGYGKADIFLPAMIGLVYGTSEKVPMLPVIGNKVLEIMSYKPGNSNFLNVMLPSNCHLWFLPAFFTGAVLFILYLNTIGKKRKFIIDTVTIFVLLILASIESFPDCVQLPYALGRGFYCCACMIAGKICCEHKIFQYLYENKLKAFIVGVILLAVAVVAYFAGASKSALVRSEYGPYGVLAPIVVYIGGISATVLALSILKIIFDKHKLRSIAFVGQHTMGVYLWHMFWVNVISILILKITGIEMAHDIWYMAIIPESHSGLIVLAAFLSVGCCIGMELLIKRLKSRTAVK